MKPKVISTGKDLIKALQKLTPEELALPIATSANNHNYESNHLGLGSCCLSTTTNGYLMIGNFDPKSNRFKNVVKE